MKACHRVTPFGGTCGAPAIAAWTADYTDTITYRCKKHPVVNDSWYEIPYEYRPKPKPFTPTRSVRPLPS